MLLEFSRFIASALICDSMWNPACWIDLPLEQLTKQLIRFVVEKVGVTSWLKDLI
jgi:hypothetical protein